MLISGWFWDCGCGFGLGHPMFIIFSVETRAVSVDHHPLLSVLLHWGFNAFSACLAPDSIWVSDLKPSFYMSTEPDL